MPEATRVAVSPARQVAFRILLLVERGGYAADLLASRSAKLDARDAALAEELVLGSLRWQGQLDWFIRQISGRDPARLDPEVRVALRLGIYQIRRLDRIPPHAAVNESVELVKRSGHRFAASFVNAVLRKVNKEPVSFPDLATELSHPAWLLERWRRHYGSETALQVARANLRAPETYVRLPAGVTKPEGVVLEPTEVPGCYRVVEGRPAGLRIQDIGSQAVTGLLDLAPGMSFLDVCAAPGNKTAQALESGCRAIACDLHLNRLRRMKDLGCPLVVADASRPLPFRARFDRILVDVPCSGTGTLARNPEIKWRLTPEKLVELHELQVRLLRNSLDLLAPGGLLLYVTCSLEPEENEDVVREVLGGPPQRMVQRLPGREPGDGFFAAVIRSS
ncbi:MAG: transcription antitermination factor NusB [Bryobacteraceae bacterium]